MDDFNKDFTVLCRKYGGFAGIIEKMAEIEHDNSLKMLYAERPARAMFYAKVAYLLTEISEYWRKDETEHNN